MNYFCSPRVCLTLTWLASVFSAAAVFIMISFTLFFSSMFVPRTTTCDSFALAKGPFK